MLQVRTYERKEGRERSKLKVDCRRAGNGAFLLSSPLSPLSCSDFFQPQAQKNRGDRI
jgi:hypothetical protein